MGVAMPYPLESRLSPTFIVLHGLRWLKYSFIVDSSRNAYLPPSTLMMVTRMRMTRRI